MILKEHARVFTADRQGNVSDFQISVWCLVLYSWNLEWFGMSRDPAGQGAAELILLPAKEKTNGKFNLISVI